MEETKPIIQQPQTQSKKRKLTNVDLRSSSFKIRALVRQLRPQFMQVLQTPDFRNCKAAQELRIQMKLLMDLYKQMTVKMEPHEKLVSGSQHFSVESAPGKISRERHWVAKASKVLQINQHTDQSADGQPRKSYIVGGSIFGWNFITFGGSSPVYYGVTKESYRNTRKSKMLGIDASFHNG